MARVLSGLKYLVGKDLAGRSLRCRPDIHRLLSKIRKHLAAFSDCEPSAARSSGDAPGGGRHGSLGRWALP
jgi:hypothetical protein